MDNLLAARLQMAISLGFHIIYACIGMALPFLMAYCHYKWLKDRKQVYLDLTKAWSKGAAIFFAVGAVSGTLLSFELGLLWPKFMEEAGPIFGLPFSWEGTAFFLEAIALGIFLYGWGKINEWVHWFFGLAVGITGMLSGILVVAANSWMNAPQGFDYHNGIFSNIDPVKAFFNTAWFSQALHMTVAAVEATCFGVAGVHALLLLKSKKSLFHTTAIKVSLLFGGVAAILQPLTGDFAAKDVAKRQPLKLAAMEAHFETSSHAPLILGGIPDLEQEKVDFALKLPSLLSFLAHGSFSSEVLGLNAFPKENWPPVLIVHFAFQIMVLCGSLLALISLVYFYSVFKKKKLLKNKKFLLLLVFFSPLGMIAVEAGWIVTEVGRQPWIIYNILKTKDSLTPMPGLQYSLVFYCIIYLLLTFIVTWLMLRQFKVAEELYPSVKMSS